MKSGEQTLGEIGVDFAISTSYNKRKREVRKLKTEKQLNNSIYLMNIITELYMKKHKLSTEEFLKLNSKTGLLGFISECPSVFDGLPLEEMLNEAEEFIGEQI